MALTGSEDPPVLSAPSGLSPSRAADFKTCPLLYRLRSIDRIPEPASPITTRGTLIHAVLEHLYQLPPADRDPDTAVELLPTEWQRLLSEDPDLATLFDTPDELAQWLANAAELVRGYFTMEDPTRLAPAELEAAVATELPSGLRLRGVIDRLDVAPSGAIRVVDYKTGTAPRAAFEAKALFQLKFYAVVLRRTTGQVPASLRLVYLADREVLDYQPSEGEIVAFERTIEALWQAIATSIAKREFRPNPSKLCGWCSFQRYCPEFGGEVPEFPALAPLGTNPEISR